MHISISIPIENNTNHYESTYAENNDVFSNREKITLQSRAQNYNSFIMLSRVDLSLSWENSTYKYRLSRHTKIKTVGFIV